MENYFIKLKEYNTERCVYIRWVDIIGMIWDPKTLTTTIGLVYVGGHVKDKIRVKETPGQIFELCRKALAKGAGNV